MSKRKTTFLVSSLTFVVILIVITVFLNFIIGSMPSSVARMDCTENKEYTLSDATKTILGKLDDIVTITYWVSEEMPSSLSSLRQDTVDFLDEIQRAAKGKVTIRVLDPEKEAKRLAVKKEKEAEDRKKELENSDFKAEDKDEDLQYNPFTGSFDKKKKTEYEKQLESLARRGIQQNVEQIIKNDKLEVAQYYSAIEISYKARKSEVISGHKKLENLEYEIASRILKLTIPEADKPVIAMFDGQPKAAPAPPPNQMQPNMPSQQSEYGFLMQLLSQFFKVKATKITKDDPIPEKTKTIIVAQPKDLNERQAYEINRFVSSGGRAIFFVGDYNVAEHKNNPMMNRYMPPMMPTKISTGLEDLFGEWGIRFNPRPLNSEDCGVISVERTGKFMGQDVRMQSLTPMPTHALSQVADFDPASPLLQGVPVVICPWSTVINVDSSDILKNKNLEADVLVRSSKKTWFGKPSFMNISDITSGGPNRLNKEAYKDFAWSGKQDLVVMLRGKFPFKWEGKEIPSWPEKAAKDNTDNKKDSKKAGDKKKTTKKAEKGHIESPKDSSIIIVGSPDFCKDKYYQYSKRYYSGNYLFMRNAVEVYSLSDNLLKIRAKQSSRRPFDPKVKEGTKVTLKWINLLGIPLLIGIMGILYALMRIHGSSMFESNFSELPKKKNESDPE